MNATIKIHLCILLSIISWGSSYVAIKIGLGGFDPFQLAAFRFFIAMITILPLAVLRGLQIPSLQQAIQILILAIIGITGYHLVINLSTVYFPPNEVSFVANSAPVFIALFSGLLLKESITVQACVGLVIALLGVGIMNLSDISLLNPALLLLLAIPLSSSIFFVLQKPLLKHLPTQDVMFYAIITGGIGLMLIDLSFFKQVFYSHWTATTAAVYLGVVPTAIAFNLWAWVLKHVKVTYASNFIYMVPVFTIIFSILLLDERPSSQALLGGLTILAGVYISTSPQK